MKKFFYFSLILLLFPSCIKANQSDTKEKDKATIDDVLANIQYIKTYEYEYEFGKVDSTSAFLINLMEFDKNGNLIKEEEFHRDAYLQKYDNTNIYTRDSKGNVLEIVEKDANGKTKQITRNKYVNNENTERIFYNKDGDITSKAVYQYDKNGNCVELISYDENGKVEYKSEYVYDSENRVKENNEYDNEGKVTSSFTTSINKNGNKEVNYFENGILTYKSIDIFYEDGSLKADEWIDLEEDYSRKSEYKYDENSLLIEKIKYSKLGEPETVERREYIRFE